MFSWGQYKGKTLRYYTHFWNIPSLLIADDDICKDILLIHETNKSRCTFTIFVNSQVCFSFLHYLKSGTNNTIPKYLPGPDSYMMEIKCRNIKFKCHSAARNTKVYTNHSVYDSATLPTVCFIEMSYNSRHFSLFWHLSGKNDNKWRAEFMGVARFRKFAECATL